MLPKRQFLSKCGLMCSVATLLLVSGCSIWQDKGPERYALAPGAKRVPMLNPGGKLTQMTAPAGNSAPMMAPQGAMIPQGAMVPPPLPPVAMQQPMPPHMMAPQPMMAPAPIVMAPAPMAMTPPPAAGVDSGFVDGAALSAIDATPVESPAAPKAAMDPSAPFEPISPMASAIPDVYAPDSEPFDLSAPASEMSPESGSDFPVLSQVPVPTTSSGERVGNAQAAARELQQELNQSESQQEQAAQQAVSDGLPWEQPSSVMASDDVPPQADMSSQMAAEQEMPWSGSAQPAPAAPIAPNRFESVEEPAVGMTAIKPAYQLPSPNVDYTVDAEQGLATLPAPPQAQSEALPPIKLVPPAPEPEMEAPTVALDVPPMRPRFVPEMPEMPAIDEVYVDDAPTIAAAPEWQDYGAPAEEIVLTPPPEVMAGVEEGFLPESRYSERRRFQRRKVRY